jgi:hypothetical protein
MIPCTHRGVVLVASTESPHPLRDRLAYGGIITTRPARNIVKIPKRSVSAPSAVGVSISGVCVGFTAVTVTGTDGPAPLYTPRLPPFVPSICTVVSESDPVGSLVLVSEYDAVGSSKNNENVSGSEPPVGAWVVKST